MYREETSQPGNVYAELDSKFLGESFRCFLIYVLYVLQKGCPAWKIRFSNLHLNSLSALSLIIYFILQALHVFYLFCQFINHMEAVWLPVYYPSQEEKDDPKLYASNVRRLMAREVCTFLDVGY